MLIDDKFLFANQVGKELPKFDVNIENAFF